MKTVIRHLRRAALLHGGEGPSDRQLLESFLSRREDASFEALLRRHGPMVLGVCRRVLRNAHDAEDAFQATFLVLMRKAGSLQSRDLLANWLYGVAYRTAMKARAMNAKRRARERHAGALPPSEKAASAADEAILEQLDHELSRLPDKYRAAVVLCELQGKSRKEAARLLAVPEGTLSWRLAQAKKLLAKRLTRHGAALSAGAVAAALTEGTVTAALSPALRASTLKTVLTAGTVPAQVLALTEGVLKTMLLAKLKITVCFAAFALLAGVGASGLTYRAAADEPARTAREGVFFVKSADNRSQNDDLEALRLEIEALRKELRATRERVKALEKVVSVPKASSNTETVPARVITSRVEYKPVERVEVKTVPARIYATVVEKAPSTAVEKVEKVILLRENGSNDPLQAAQDALKKLRTNPDDKQAAEAVEKALKWLKSREKSEKHGGEKR